MELFTKCIRETYRNRFTCLPEFSAEITDPLGQLQIRFSNNSIVKSTSLAAPCKHALRSRFSLSHLVSLLPVFGSLLQQLLINRCCALPIFGNQKVTLPRENGP